jgi:hypothetical protein
MRHQLLCTADHEEIRYIKLGAGATSTDEFCIENNVAYMGFGTSDEILFQFAQTGNWESFKLLTYERDRQGSERARRQRATSATNQVRAFFECNEKTLWITFFAGFLYYGSFSGAATPSIDFDLGGCTRPLTVGWSCEDANKRQLKIENLSGNLTKIRGFQGTSCALDQDQKRYILTRLSGKVPPYIDQIELARESMVEAVKHAIKALHPKDFEVLVEIIFSRTWRRIGQAGGVERFVDIIFEDPLNPHQRIAIQVKSQTSIKQIEEYCYDRQMERYEKFFFVFHTPDSSDLAMKASLPGNVEIVDGDRLANLVVDSGLVHWLKEKTT